MKFRIKVTLCMISLMAILFAIGGTALIYNSFENSMAREISSAQKSYDMILNTLKIVNNTSTWNSADDICDTIKQISSQNESFCAMRLSSKDEVIYASGEAVDIYQDLSSHADSTHVSYIVISDRDKYFLQLCGTFNVGISLMYLDAAYDITSVYVMHQEQQQTYIRIFCVLITLCAIFSYLLSFILTKPLTHLSKVASEISSGNYEQRSRLNSKDEIGLLSKEFDKMADTLVLQMDELNAAIERQNQFIGDFTHELKTPMTSIIGYADLLRRNTLSKEDADDAANYIFSEGRRLERLSIKMLELIVAEQEQLELVSTNPSEIIKNLIIHLEKKYNNQSIHFITELDDGRCMLEPDLFSSLIINLLENAKRAMPDGGTISIFSEIAENGCIVSVSDTGQGIPAEALNHITEAFYRVDKARSRAHGGAGLGLTLCAKIAKLHNGSISIESQVDRGTKITVNLEGGAV